jgi:hypothetical protein
MKGENMLKPVSNKDPPVRPERACWKTDKENSLRNDN